MASATSIAIRRLEAIERLQTAAATLGERLGVDVPDLRPAHRDPDIARAMEIEAVAGLLEDVVSSLPAPAAPVTAPVSKRTR